jgi:nitrous oxidase accessory protein
VYRNNTFIRNSAGVAVMYTHHIVMERNRFEQNWGAASFGILLKDISASRIVHNVFLNNSVGLYAEGCNRNDISGNTFASNGWGMRIMANSTDNRIVDNNFVSNTFEVTTNSRTSHNLFDRNYWSDYAGYDLDRDGIGDVPHRPVRLFAVLIDKYPGSLILLRSALQNILEMAERFLPVLTPANLMDAHPRMARIS